MKLLLDSCVWGPVADVLRDAGHDVVWTGDWPQDPGDEEILATANSEERILVTLDKDFGELAMMCSSLNSIGPKANRPVLSSRGNRDYDGSDGLSRT